MSQSIPTYTHCFVCGDQNPQGLHLHFHWDGSRARTTLNAELLNEGYAGIFHGGLTATILDEIMVKAILAQNEFAVTAEFSISYHAPIRTGDTISFWGEILKRKGRLILCQAGAEVDGKIVATASGKYIVPEVNLRDELQTSLTVEKEK